MRSQAIPPSPFGLVRKPKSGTRPPPEEGSARTTWIEVKLFLREPLTVIFTLALPLLFLFVLGGVFGNTPDAGYYRGAGPLDFYVPAYIALVWTAVGLLALPVRLARYREDGVLRRLRASSARPWVVFGSQIAVSFLVAFVGALLVLVSAWLAYDVHMPVSMPLFWVQRKWT